jgi:hypothetical protein
MSTLGSMPSLAQSTSTRLDSACKHIQQCRVSQDHMAKFVKNNDTDELIRNKFRYCVHKDELVIGIGKCWAKDSSKKFQNNAYPRVVSNLGQLIESDGNEPSDTEKLIKLMYHNATSIPMRNEILRRFQDASVAEFPVPPDGTDPYLKHPLAGAANPNFMPFRQSVPNIHDFVTVGYSNTLGWAHAHCGDTMTSVMIGGLRTVLNGDFEMFCGDLIQWYWPFEKDCFERDGRRKDIIYEPGAGIVDLGRLPDLQKNPRGANDFDPDRETGLRRKFFDQQYGQKKGVEKVVPLIKPYKRDDRDPRIYDWYRVFAVALCSARPREGVDIRICRQAL